MPVPVPDRPEVNIWIAAGDGKLDVVKTWVENLSVSPNEPDAFTYTPMHAATSYGHLEVLEYLIWKGGNVNVVDEDGETPLFVAESVDVARFLVEHGARPDHRNLDGMSPAESLYEEYPEISSYLESVLPTSTRSLPHETDEVYVEETAENASEELTSSLLTSIEGIMIRAEEDGHDPEDEIRQAVEEAVIEGVVRGYNMTGEEDLNDGNGPEPPGLGPRA